CHLYLDEIGEMPAGAQAKLLRVLQDKCVRRLGSMESREVRVRFIAATNRSLRELVRERAFREDLYFRLDVMTLELPPLRERREDIRLLAEHFAERWAAAYGRPAPSLSEATLEKLLAHRWPGKRARTGERHPSRGGGDRRLRDRAAPSPPRSHPASGRRPARRPVVGRGAEGAHLLDAGPGGRQPQARGRADGHGRADAAQPP